MKINNSKKTLKSRSGKTLRNLSKKSLRTLSKKSLKNLSKKTRRSNSKKNSKRRIHGGSTSLGDMTDILDDWNRAGYDPDDEDTWDEYPGGDLGLSTAQLERYILRDKFDDFFMRTEILEMGGMPSSAGDTDWTYEGWNEYLNQVVALRIGNQDFGSLNKNEQNLVAITFKFFGYLVSTGDFWIMNRVFWDSGMHKALRWVIISLIGLVYSKEASAAVTALSLTTEASCTLIKKIFSRFTWDTFSITDLIKDAKEGGKIVNEIKDTVEKLSE